MLPPSERIAVALENIAVDVGRVADHLTEPRTLPPNGVEPPEHTTIIWSPTLETLAVERARIDDEDLEWFWPNGPGGLS